MVLTGFVKCVRIININNNINWLTNLPHPGTQLQSSYSNPTQRSSVRPSKTGKKGGGGGGSLLVPIKFRDCTTLYCLSVLYGP